MTSNGARETAASTPEPRTEEAAALLRRLDDSPVTGWHRRLVILVGAGGFFNFVEIALGSLLVPLIGEHWSLTTIEQSALIAATFAGEAIGSIVLSPLADKFGRARMFQVNLAAYALLSLLSAFSPNVAVLIALRVLLGVGLGAELTLVDSYLAETMPSRRRGRLLSLSYTLALIAVPVTGVATVVTPETIGGVAGWRWILGVAALLALVVWLLRRRLPESPRWLITRGRVAEARDIIEPLPARTDAIPTDAGDQATPSPAMAEIPIPPRRELNRRRLLLYIMHSLGPIGFYGFASIAPLVLIDKGFSVVHSLGYTALSAIGYPLGSLICMFLAERAQRRTLLIGATVATAIFGTVFGLSTSAALIVAAGFLTGLTSVVQSNLTHIYQAELFPTSIRAQAIGRPYAVSRIVSAVLPFLTLPILYSLGAGPLYAICGGLVLISAVAIGILGPRTNARSLEAV